MTNDDWSLKTISLFQAPVVSRHSFELAIEKRLQESRCGEGVQAFLFLFAGDLLAAGLAVDQRLLRGEAAEALVDEDYWEIRAGGEVLSPRDRAPRRGAERIVHVQRQTQDDLLHGFFGDDRNDL